MFVRHLVYEAGQTLPPISSDCLYEYVLAANGVFVRSERDGLSATIPVLSSRPDTPIRGLEQVRPEVRIAQRVSLERTNYILSVCEDAMPDECLMWIGYKGGDYCLTVPEQEAGRMRVRPASPFQQEGADALIDLHSHNSMAPVFSVTDDKDETGFRIFAVVGLLNSQPSILVRVGIFGHFALLKAKTVFEMPLELQDYREWKACSR